MRLSTVAAVAMLVSSCQPEWGDAQKIMVVEGWIEQGDPPVVILSETMQVSNRKQSLDDCVVATAKVTVSDGDTTVTLSGGIDHDYFPPYIYTTSHIEGKVGHTYKLDIYYHDCHYSAVTTIPEPCGIDSICVCTDDSTHYGIRVAFKDNPATHNCYQFFVRTRGKDTRFMPSVLGFIDNRNLNVLTTSVDDENVILHSVYPGQHIKAAGHYNMFFEKNDTVQVKLATMDSTAAAFWSSYQTVALTTDMALFSGTETMQGNVPGAKGYWCGYGISKARVIIE